MNIKQIQIVRSARVVVPAIALIAAGAVGVGFSHRSDGYRVSATAETASTPSVSASESPAPAINDQQVTVNGEVITPDKNGTTTVQSTSTSKTTVEVSGDGKTVTTTQTSQPTANSDKAGNLNVSVNSSSNGGSSWGSTHVFGTSFSSSHNGTTNGFNSTHVFSTDLANTNVTP